MDIVSAPTAGSARAALARHLREPLHRSSYALILGSAVASGLGYIFWIIAARRFTADAVGMATTLIAAMGFLANLATLGLRGALVRFLPNAGSGALRLILRSYLLCGAAATVAAVVFVAGQPIWATNLGLLRGSAIAAVVFVTATVIWLVMVLQEYVLIGLRRATWVPVASTAYAVLKIAMLVLVTGTSAWFIFAAYALPAGIVLAVVSVLVLRSVARQNATVWGRSVPALVGLSRFAAGDHTAAMLWLGTTDLLPLLVLEQAGAAASAYYYLAFSAGYTLYLITANISNALVAEASENISELGVLAGRALRNGLLLLVPIVLVGLLVAPYVLQVIGKAYASEATGVLRLFLLSAIPQLIIGVAMSVARVRKQIGRIVLVYLVIAVLVFGAAPVALATLGLAGLGMVWLLVQVVVAIGLMATQLAFLWTGSTIELIVRRISRVESEFRRTRRNRDVRRVVQAIADDTDCPITEPVLMTSDNDTLVVAALTGKRRVVIKIAGSVQTSASIAREHRVLETLTRHPGAHEISYLLPSVLRRGDFDGCAYLIETRLPGTAVSMVGEPTRGVPVAAAIAARHLDHLYRGTAKLASCGEVLRGLVDEPIMAITALPSGHRRTTQLAALRKLLIGPLSASGLTVSWTHGDCWLGNVLAEGADADDPRIVGLIDWEDAQPDGLPDVDLAHLWLTAQGGNMANQLLRAIDGQAVAFDSWLDDNGLNRPNRQLDGAFVLALVWLAHVQSGIRRCPPAGPGWLWRRRTVDAVLEGIVPALEGMLRRRGEL